MNCIGVPCPSLSGDVSDAKLLSRELGFQGWTKRNNIAVLLFFLMITSSTVVPVDLRHDRKTLSPVGFANESLGRYSSQRWLLRKRRVPILKISKPVENPLVHDASRGTLQTSSKIDPRVLEHLKSNLYSPDGITNEIPAIQSSQRPSRKIPLIDTEITGKPASKSFSRMSSFINASTNSNLTSSSIFDARKSKKFAVITYSRKSWKVNGKQVLCYEIDKSKHFPSIRCRLCDMINKTLDFVRVNKRDLVGARVIKCADDVSVEEIESNDLSLPLLKEAFSRKTHSSKNQCNCLILLNQTLQRQFQGKYKEISNYDEKGKNKGVEYLVNHPLDSKTETNILSALLKNANSPGRHHKVKETLKRKDQVRTKRFLSSVVDGDKTFSRRSKRSKKNITLSGKESKRKRYRTSHEQEGLVKMKYNWKIIFLSDKAYNSRNNTLNSNARSSLNKSYASGDGKDYSLRNNSQKENISNQMKNCSKTGIPNTKLRPVLDEKYEKDLTRICKRENGRYSWRELSSSYKRKPEKSRELFQVIPGIRTSNASHQLGVIPGSSSTTMKRSTKGQDKKTWKKGSQIVSPSGDKLRSLLPTNSTDKTNTPTTSQQRPSNTLLHWRFRTKKARRKFHANTNERQEKVWDVFDENISSESLNEGKSFRDPVGYSGASRSSKGIDEPLETNFLNTRKSEEDAETFLGDERNLAKKLGLSRGHQKMMGRRRKRKIDISNVSVVEGEEAALPCDLRSSDPDDTVQIILWIKEGLHTPLYSFDFRELMRGQPKETKPHSNSTMSKRTSFRTDRSPAALIIQRTEMEDAGIYRCRVDFRHSPTLNYRVNLTVVVAPTSVRISWYTNGSSVSAQNGEVGPFLERSQPTIICTNDDGWPPPSVMWYEDDQLLDDSFYVDYNQGVVENEMVLPPLTRNDLKRNLTCLASNTDKQPPASKSVRIDMTLRIIGVKLMDLGTIWAQEKARAVCHIWGSRPKPNVLWWLGSRMLQPDKTTISEQDENVTLSYLDFLPTSKEDGAMLICQATNEKLPDQAVQDSTILSVNYAPEVSVHLGHSLDPEKIKEGDDVYFECTVLSKPPVHNVIWKHNGVKLVAGSGIILSNMSLVVQGVTRSHGGNYTCHATNVRKTSASAPMHLDVKYTPFCASVQRQHHSVGKLENAEISCKVDANPKNVSFRWTFNNTAEAIDVPEGRFVVVGTESRVNYTPMNELDYGTLLCWANNSIGIQQYPCVFHIVAAGKPDPPHNCRVFDVTISSFQVMCLPGDDGGLNQMFILHLYKVGAVSPMAEFSQTSPSFTINNLQPATSYRIVLASVNDKGTSRLIELNAYTIKVLEKLEETSAEPARDRVRGKGIPLEVILGIIAGVVSLILASVVVVWFRVCRVHTSDEEETDESAGSGSEASSKCQLKDTATAETAVSEATPQVTRHHDIQQSADPSSWSVEGPLIATISAPPYVVAGGDKQYPLATGAPAPASEVTGPQYSQYPEQGSYYTYSQCSAEVQLPTPARKQHNVPYYTDSAQLQQVQDPSSIGPSSLDYNSCVLQLPPPLGHLDQEEKYLVSSQRGELGPAEGQVAATGQDHGQAFPALLHILPGSVSKAPTSSHCSIHHCQNELFPVLESSSIPPVNQGMNRKGSLKVLSQYRDAIPDPLPASVPSFQSMEDVSKSQRKYAVPVDQFTASLNRVKHFKTEPSKEGVDACQLLTNTIPRSQRKNKMESSV